MIAASELAGYFAAHAIWCVSDGVTLIPMLAYSKGDERQMERMAHEELSEAVEIGKEKLELNPMDAEDAVLAYDGRITIEDEKLDAILLELRAYFTPASKAVIAIPYTPKSRRMLFRVHKPKLLEWEQCDDFDIDAVFEAFFNGVSDHDKGFEIWNKCLDESK